MGGPQATETGTATYVAPGQISADGKPEQATIVAWDLGTCGGKPAYRAYNWYFPQHDGKLDTTKYFSACDQSHVGM